MRDTSVIDPGTGTASGDTRTGCGVTAFWTRVETYGGQVVGAVAAAADPSPAAADTT